MKTMQYPSKILEEPTELAYDLRQIFANEVIGTTLKNIKTYREERDYKNWFEELDGLFIDISMKFKSDELIIYNNKIKKLNKLIEEEPDVYLNQKLEGAKIYESLKEINMWLLKKMEKYKMFGSKQDIEGLM